MIIDVSHNNGAIDWNRVKPNIDKAILRVGYGNDSTSQDDRQFQQNQSECRRLGIPIDYYIYSYARNIEDAKSEARHALRLATDTNAVIYFDSEEPGTQPVARQCAEVFRDAIKAAGRKVGLYASESWYNSYLGGIDGFDKIWIAKYGANNGQQNQRPNVDCDLWQFSSRGAIPGINGAVDVNIQLKADTPTPEPFTPPPTTKNGVYRVFNKNSGEHLFTLSAVERDNLLKAGWSYEGVAWIAPPSSTTPVTRLYSGKSHMYTTSKKEIDTLLKKGWKKEGTAFYSDNKKHIPIYRLYDKNSGQHMFTRSITEKNTLVNKGWSYEGIAFYGE